MSMQRRMRRNAEKQARNRAAIKGEGPLPGDVVVGCIHKPDPRLGAHVFYVGTDTGKPALKVSKGQRSEMAKWVFLCQECNNTHGANITEALDAQKVPLRFVHTWTEEDGKLNIFPVTFTKRNDDEQDGSEH